MSPGTLRTGETGAGRWLTPETVIGGVPSLLGVRSITVAARGVHLPREFTPVYRVSDHQVLGLTNDPRTPARGSIKVHMGSAYERDQVTWYRCSSTARPDDRLPTTGSCRTAP